MELHGLLQRLDPPLQVHLIADLALILKQMLDTLHPQNVLFEYVHSIWKNLISCNVLENVQNPPLTFLDVLLTNKH